MTLPIDGSNVSRRAWLTTASGFIAAGLLKTQGDAIKLVAQQAPMTAADPTKGTWTPRVGGRSESARRTATQNLKGPGIIEFIA